MNRQQIRQAARKKALESQEGRRRERAAQDKRLEGLAVDVLVAVAERAEAIAEAEHRAGVAVRLMLEEGISASIVAQWCGDTVSAREVRRLAHFMHVEDEAHAESEPVAVSSKSHSAPGQELRSG